MKKIVIAPDKFKGSLTALEVCNAVEKGIKNSFPKTEIVKLPLADGGEGSLEALETTIKYKRRYLKVRNPLFCSIETWYGLKDNTAYIEMAKASGLELLKNEERNPKFTSSFGTGELIADAVRNGAEKIFLFIGGSATNDAAIGIASALGYKFYDSKKNELKPIGENLNRINDIKFFPTVSLNNVDITVLTDVQNTFFGKNGAAYVYAAQKGAEEKSIAELDLGLKNISKLYKDLFGKDISSIPGSGAAGGVGGGMMAFFNAKLKSGIDVIFEMLSFNDLIKDSDFVITGEGKFDIQTLEGKVVKGVIDKARKMSKPIGIVCGTSTFTEDELKKMEITVCQIKTESVSTEESINNAYKYLVEKTEQLLKDSKTLFLHSF